MIKSDNRMWYILINSKTSNFNPLMYIKQNEKIRLRKKSNGLGLFVLSYYLTMLLSASIIANLLYILCADKYMTNENNSATYFHNIFVSVFSAFIPSIIYLIKSKSDINKIIDCRKLKISFLIPVTMIGMAGAMIANCASDIVSENFSLFGLQNKVNFNNSSSSLLNNMLYIVSTSIVPAFAEEFAFRGIIMGTLRKYGDVFAIIASSVLFGAMHGNITQIPFAFILGLILAFVDCKTNSILPSIVIHFTNNFYAVIIDILKNEGFIAKADFYIIHYIIITAFCSLGLISFFYIVKRNKNFLNISDKYASCNQYVRILTLKEKNTTFFLSPGIILVLSVFLIRTILNLI